MPQSHERSDFIPGAEVLTEKAGGQIGRCYSEATLRVVMRRADAEGEFQRVDDQLQCEREHCNNEAEPLLRSQSRWQRVDHRGDEDGEDEQNQTNDDYHAENSVHRPGV